MCCHGQVKGLNKKYVKSQPKFDSKNVKDFQKIFDTSLKHCNQFLETKYKELTGELKTLAIFNILQV